MAKCPQCGKIHNNRLSKFCSRPCTDLHVLNYKDTVSIKTVAESADRAYKLQATINRSKQLKEAAEEQARSKERRTVWYNNTISKCEWRVQPDKIKIKLVKYQQNDKCFKCKKEQLLIPVYLDGNNKNKDRTNIVCVCSRCIGNMKKEIHFNLKASRNTKKEENKTDKI